MSDHIAVGVKKPAVFVTLRQYVYKRQSIDLDCHFLAVQLLADITYRIADDIHGSSRSG